MQYDQVIDYKNEDTDAALATLFPEGIDLYFDNVGGPLLDTVLGGCGVEHVSSFVVGSLRHLI